MTQVFLCTRGDTPHAADRTLPRTLPAQERDARQRDDGPATLRANDKVFHDCDHVA
jgi:hypothetical protein